MDQEGISLPPAVSNKYFTAFIAMGQVLQLHRISHHLLEFKNQIHLPTETYIYYGGQNHL